MNCVRNRPSWRRPHGYDSWVSWCHALDPNPIQVVTLSWLWRHTITLDWNWMTWSWSWPSYHTHYQWRPCGYDSWPWPGQRPNYIVKQSIYILLISWRTTPVYCKVQELSIDMLRKCVFSRCFTAHCYNGVLWDRHLYGGSRPPPNTWFSGPIRVLLPNGISISSAVFGGLTNVTSAAVWDEDSARPKMIRAVSLRLIYIELTWCSSPLLCVLRWKFCSACHRWLLITWYFVRWGRLKAWFSTNFSLYFRNGAR